MEVILASRSPRRLKLLQSAGLAVEVRPSHIDETPQPDETVMQMVKRLSREKAMACPAAAGIPVVAADTMVSIDAHLLGQPKNLDEVKSMLLKLSGRKHQVLTGVCVRLNRIIAEQQIVTKVHFRALNATEIDTYLAHNEVLDKAGAYAIQGGAASFITAIEGPLDNVIGLPLGTTLEMIHRCLSSKAADSDPQ